MANQDYTIKPFGKIHELQISDKEMYAFEPCYWILSMTIRLVFDLRKEVGHLLDTPCKDVLSMLAEIQALEGKVVILNDLVEQLDL